MLFTTSISLHVEFVILSDIFNFLSANPTKWSYALKQFVGNFPTNCLSVFDHFVKLALKGLRPSQTGVEFIWESS